MEIAAGSKPPVCKIIDYGKYSYEKQKKDKLTKKNQNEVTGDMMGQFDATGKRIKADKANKSKKKK